MHSLTIENYVKTIYKISIRTEGATATTGQLATELGVSPGTVTSMLKTLSGSRLVTYTRYEGVRLTDAGRTLALCVLRRHRLIELFLVKTLNLSWDEVHDEAEHMEHAVSELLVDRIDEYMNYPETDPHGDPIPRADGTIPAGHCNSLAACDVGNSFRFVRVLDQSSKFLRFLSELGIPLGTEGDILEKRNEADTVRIRVGEVETVLGRDAAEKILVTVPADVQPTLFC